jgi:hypothetical protein
MGGRKARDIGQLNEKSRELYPPPAAGLFDYKFPSRKCKSHEQKYSLMPLALCLEPVQWK